MNFWIFMSIGGFLVALVLALVAWRTSDDGDDFEGGVYRGFALIAFLISFLISWVMLGHGLFVEGKPAPQQVEAGR